MSLEKRNVAEPGRTKCDRCSRTVGGTALAESGPIICAGCKALPLTKDASNTPTLKELPDRLADDWGK